MGGWVCSPPSRGRWVGAKGVEGKSCFFCLCVCEWVGVHPGGGGGVGTRPRCLSLALPIGLWPLYILTLCGSKRVLVVSTEPLNDLSRLTTLDVGRPGDRLLQNARRTGDSCQAGQLAPFTEWGRAVSSRQMYPDALVLQTEWGVWAGLYPTHKNKEVC